MKYKINYQWTNYAGDILHCSVWARTLDEVALYIVLLWKYEGYKVLSVRREDGREMFF